jgi:large repetitive protein
MSAIQSTAGPALSSLQLKVGLILGGTATLGLGAILTKIPDWAKADDTPKTTENTLGSGGKQIIGTEKDDLLEGGSGNDFIAGLAGNDTLNGKDGNDQLHGNTGNDTLVGGGGDDRIWGNAGDDNLRGDAGADQFVFTEKNSGADVIEDFQEGDKLHFEKELVTLKFSDFTISQVGSDTVVADPKDGIKITLKNVAANTVTEQDFAFV